MLYYCLASIMVLLSFGFITVQISAIYYTQIAVYATSVLLFTTLILSPKPHLKQHSYSFFAECEDVNRLCMDCLKPLQSREYHCATCHICIPQYDHHCFWINNCVGKRNLLRFNLFLVLTEASLLWLGYLSVRVFILLQQQKK
jgi:palmitoyltransferase